MRDVPRSGPRLRAARTISPCSSAARRCDQAGTRAVPSLRYKEYTPPYADLLDNPDGISAPGPGGGFTWDGRADTLAEQAKIPLLSPFEMANASAADVVAKVAGVAYAALFQQAFGAQCLRRPRAPPSTTRAAALQAFQLEDASFHPYSSKYDLYAGNKIGGDADGRRARGFAVFDDPDNGQLFRLPLPRRGPERQLGAVHRLTRTKPSACRATRRSPPTRDPTYFDLGVCGPRAPTTRRTARPSTFCGMFKTPTLRNVATRSVFFHNGVIHIARAGRSASTTRATPMPAALVPDGRRHAEGANDPGFPTYGLVTTQYVGGKVQKFDDLPPAYLANIDPQMPLDGRAPAWPPMTDQNMADLICFLNTLNDGYVPFKTPPASGPCVN